MTCNKLKVRFFAILGLIVGLGLAIVVTHRGSVSSEFQNHYRVTDFKQIVIPRSVAKINDSCVTGKVAGLQFPICTYTPAEDPIVSAYIQSGRYWEPEMVTSLMDIVKQDKSTVFIDIGTNVGAYSLAMAHAGHRVGTVRHVLKHSSNCDLDGIAQTAELINNFACEKRLVRRDNLFGRVKTSTYVNTALNSDSCVDYFLFLMLAKL